MSQNAQPEPDDDDQIAQLEVEMDDLFTFMTQVQTDGADEFLITSHLKIIIDSSDFGDWEDDVWCLFLATFAPLSQKVTHLSIYIRGDTLFTRNNYVKAQISTLEEVVPVSKGKGIDRELGLHYPTPIFDDNYEEGPSKKPKFTRSTFNSTANAKPLPSLNTPAATDSANNKGGTHYTTKQLPSHKTNLHIYEKAMIPTLINLFKNRTPLLSKITIQGPMELSLRRHIISSINPSYLSFPTLVTEMGYDTLDSALASEVEAWELSAPQAAIIKQAIQDPEDFGQWGKKDMESVNMHGLGEWIVPSGKGGRGVWGWKVGGGVRVWKGPSVGWEGREGI